MVYRSASFSCIVAAVVTTHGLSSFTSLTQQSSNRKMELRAKAPSYKAEDLEPRGQPLDQKARRFESAKPRGARIGPCAVLGPDRRLALLHYRGRAGCGARRVWPQVVGEPRAPLGRGLGVGLQRGASDRQRGARALGPAVSSGDVLSWPTDGRTDRQTHGALQPASGPEGA